MAEYRKLYRDLNYLFGRNSLWLSEDHLLVSRHCFIVEQYRRYFFSDIQAITVYRTHIGKIWNACWGFWLLITAGPAMVFYFVETAIGIFFLINAILPLLLLMINIVRGPTSQVVIRTLTTEDRVILTGRFWKTVLLLPKLRQEIEMLQGDTEPEAIIQGMIGDDGDEKQGAEV